MQSTRRHRSVLHPPASRSSSPSTRCPARPSPCSRTARSSTPRRACSARRRASTSPPTRSSRSARSPRCGRRRWSCSSSTRDCSTSTRRSAATCPSSGSQDESAAASITTRQLLSHQAGFEGDVFTDTGRGDDAIEKYVDVDRRPAAAVLAGRAVLVQQRRLQRPRPARRGAARQDVGAGARRPHRDAARTHPRRPERLRGDPPPRRGRPRRTRRGRRRDPRPDLGARPLERAGRLDARDEPARPPRLRGDAPRGRRRTRRHPHPVAAVGTRHAHRAGRASPPHRHGGGLGPRLGDHRQPTPRSSSATTAARSARPPSCASCPRPAWPSRSSPTAATSSGSSRMSSRRSSARSPTSRCPGTRCRSTSRSAVEPRPLLGLYADTIYDLVVSVDDEGRIWLDRTPKDIIAEIGEKPMRTELVGFGEDSLIARRGHARHPPDLRLPRRRRRRQAQVHPLRPRRHARRLTRSPPTAPPPRTHTVRPSQRGIPCDPSESQHSPSSRHPPRSSPSQAARRGGGGDVVHRQVRRRQDVRPRPRRRPRRARPADVGGRRPVRACRSSPTTRSSASTQKGEIGSQLAKDWKVDGTTVTLTLNDGITCSDGSTSPPRPPPTTSRGSATPRTRARSSARSCPAASRPTASTAAP